MLRGESNHGLLARATFVREAATAVGFTLYALDGHPGMSAEGGGIVHGEVFDVDSATLERLDALEGHPDWYRRSPLRLADGESVETYLLPSRFTGACPVIAHGDWRRWRRNL